MALLGSAALVVCGALGQPQDVWHSAEHLPERMGLPGFLRGRRAVAPDAPDRLLVVYEADDVAAFSSAAYQERLNNPTPWTARVMSSFGHLARTPCSVAHSFGSGVAAHLLSIEVTPAAAESAALHDWLERALSDACAQAGITAAHYLVGVPDSPTLTQEQRLRRTPDRGVAAMVLLEGFDSRALDALGRGALSPARIRAQGVAHAGEPMAWNLAHCMTPQDCAQGALP